MSTNFLPFLILPIPTEIPTGFGIHSTTGPEGVLIQCRGLVAEREYIKKAADAVGMTYGSFMRRVVTDAASAVLHQIGDQSKILPKYEDVTHRTVDGDINVNNPNTAED